MSKTPHKFPYRWTLADGYPAAGIEYHGLKVFGTFVCGGGSTMGYKLAGYDHLGGVEIDPTIAKPYVANHKPKHFYLEDIRLFNERQDLPAELYDLDLLDGSPPCSSFSMAGNRDKDWGKKKQFKEGQELQRLDDLVFEYCNTIIKLRPKVFLLENVKGIIAGNAKAYSKNIVKIMTEAGYQVQVFLLNAASMGVPQKRERVFFIGHRKELELQPLRLSFNEPAIPFYKVSAQSKSEGFEFDIVPSHLPYYDQCKPGKALSSVHPKGNCFSTGKVDSTSVMHTITADNGGGRMLHDIEKRYLNNDEYKLGGSYPMDYDFKEVKPKYLIGMSVPPVMTAQIAHQIYLQWFKPGKAKQ